MAPPKIRRDVEEPSVLVLTEKHGSYYFHIPDEETLHATALFVLTERFNENYWYGGDPSEYETAPKPLGMTKEQIDALPEGPIKVAAKKQHATYSYELRRHRQEIEDYAELKKAVEEKDGKLAWRALKARSGNEYEGVRLEAYEKVR